MATEACPCGYLGDANSKCRCTAEQVQRYRARISGPLLDRLDMHVEVPRLNADALQGQAPGEGSDVIAARVRSARERQWQRQQRCNAQLQPGEIERWCEASTGAQQLLARAMQKFALSARAYHRILKVARTIADLGANAHIDVPHMSEAIALRRLDRGEAAMT